MSISRAWDESKAVLAHDGKLIGTVALALFVLPGLVLNLTMPARSSAEVPRPSGWMLVGVVAILVSLVGQLSVVRLSMAPHVSVGEAIAHAARRLLSYIGAALIWTVPFLLIGSFFYALAGDREHPSLTASVILLVVSLVGLFLAVRFVLISATAVAERGSPIAVLRRSWALTSGNWWRLFGFLFLFILGAMALLFAVQSVAVLVGRLLFGDISPLSLGGVIVSICSQLVSAGVSVLLFVMLARIYVQLSDGAPADVSVPSSGI